ncbi:MAG: efflux RND transporter periplasmic adaptor subunit [Planctomycetia bacterium]|nr:efflux RND transporter periplasmic adaptor subunit [Planctomycetia bacterium]
MSEPASSESAASQTTSRRNPVPRLRGPSASMPDATPVVADAAAPTSQPPAGHDDLADEAAGAPRRWWSHAVSTAAVVAVLTGLAVWGHATQWTMPKFSSLIGRGSGAADDWCSEHNVPESQCIECNPKLAPKSKDFGWCETHGVGQCPLEHPEVVQLKNPPSVGTADLDRAGRALTLMPRTANSSSCKMRDKRIQFASIEAMTKTGVDIAVVEQGPLTESLQANGEVVYDENAAAHLASRAAGTVWRVDRQVGDRVARGDVLALIDSPAIGQAKAELLQAVAQIRLKHADVTRLGPLAAEGIVAGRRIREAQAELDAAQIRLAEVQQTLSGFGLGMVPPAMLDLPVDQLAVQLRYFGLPGDLGERSGQPISGNLFPLRSPLNGVVVQRHATAGEQVDTATMLFSVADVARMWLNLDVRQEDIPYLSAGQTVLFHISNGGQEPDHQGTIRWISTAVDPQTRTVKVRVELANADGRLRAHTFGTARIVLRTEPKAILVPAEAVHWEGDCNLVFVRDKDFLKPDSLKFFHVRQVRVGARDGDRQEIIAGLLPGEVIAGRNSFVLQAQLLKSSLGAGCGCCNGEAK